MLGFPWAGWSIDHLPWLASIIFTLQLGNQKFTETKGLDQDHLVWLHIDFYLFPSVM